MNLPQFRRLPRHIAVIPDGNRRWAQARGMGREEGYAHGIQPTVDMCELCIALGIGEVTIYGFTQDNTKRPSEQRYAFQEACVDGARRLLGHDVEFTVVGDTSSPMFPEELKPFAGHRTVFGNGGMKVNFLVNYDWHWDLSQALLADPGTPGRSRRTFLESIGSADVSRIDLLIRWGGRRRLSGMLPVQSVYTDIYTLDALWPDFQPDQLFEALRWYEVQDVTLGG